MKKNPVCVTLGVKISVEVFYQQDYSNPLQSEFMFAYRIYIENTNKFPVKLISRHWYIFDSGPQAILENNCSRKYKNSACGPMFREVEGEGVVGMQPVINANDEYQYVSGCNLQSEIGRMHGTYFMENLHTKEMFEVYVPAFEMITPFKFN